METIKINEIVKKDSGLVIVKYTNNLTTHELEATMNTRWQSQDVDYIEKDVGIGGTVSVLIVPKGDYINITKVDMKSAVKGDRPMDVRQEAEQGNTQSAYTPKPDREKTIIAQCLTKIVYRNAAFGNNEEALREVLDAYNYFLGEL